MKKLHFFVLGLALVAVFSVGAFGQTNVQDVLAHSDDVIYSVFGSAVIDGVKSPREWDSATQILVFPTAPDPLSQSTLFFKNDSSNLYFALSVPDDNLTFRDHFEIRLDNDHNGTIDIGDDNLYLFGNSHFLDAYFNGSYSRIPDAQQDGSGMAGNRRGVNFFEISHPLNSGDANDIAISSTGDIIGFCIRYFSDGISTDRTSFPFIYNPPDRVASCISVVEKQELYADLITVSPIPLLEQLKQDVLDLDLNQGLERSLVQKLDEALDKLTDDNPNNDHVATNKLQDFIDEVNAQRGKGISEADADALIAAAEEIILLFSSS